MKILKNALLSLALFIGAFLTANTLGALVMSSTAEAASCWDHNGSLMRLEASGNRRWFYYERPRSVLRRAGVRPGTLLFSGRKNGNRYVGTARRFSKFCPGNPLKYRVSGPVSSNQLRVTVRGNRDIFRACKNTGRNVRDTLVFTYSHEC